MRLLQGLSVGGEYGTSSILLVERSPVERRGFLGSLTALGSNAGFLLGSAVGAVVTTLLDRSAVMNWGWRVPFLAGSLIGIFGYWIRRRLADDDREPEYSRSSSPVREAFRTEWRSILQLVGLNVVGAVSFYLCFVYVTTYFRQIDHMAQSTALEINTIALIVLSLLTAPAGALSDRIGRKL